MVKIKGIPSKPSKILLSDLEPCFRDMVAMPGRLCGDNNDAGVWESRTERIKKARDGLGYDIWDTGIDKSLFLDEDGKQYTGPEYDEVISYIRDYQKKMDGSREYGHVGDACNLVVDANGNELTIEEQRKKLDKAAHRHHKMTRDFAFLRFCFPRAHDFDKKRSICCFKFTKAMWYLLQESHYIYRGMTYDEYVIASENGYLAPKQPEIGAGLSDQPTAGPNLAAKTQPYMFFTTNPFIARLYARAHKGVSVQIPIEKVKGIRATCYDYIPYGMIDESDDIPIMLAENEIVRVKERIPFDEITMTWRGGNQNEECMHLPLWMDDPFP